MSARRPSKPSRSPLVGRYLVQHRGWNTFLRSCDAVLAMLSRPSARRATPLRRVLICVGGHLGDAVMATRTIAQLRRALPGVDIGILSGGWNRAVLEPHPSVRWFHRVDHWKLNRNGKPLLTRWLHFRRTRASAVTEIRAVKYDAAVDLYAYYPNFASVLAAGRVPVRIGYAAGGFGPLYTRALSWSPEQTIADDHRLILEALIPGMDWDEAIGYDIPRPSDESIRKTRDIVGPDTWKQNFVVMHVGTGSAHKLWPVEKWTATAQALTSMGIGVVLTGSGPADAKLTRHVESVVPAVKNVCDRLSWNELIALIAQAGLVLSGDTVVMHLAAAVRSPSIAITPGTDNAARWTPPSRLHRSLSHAVICSPCFRSAGCDDMSCVRAVEVDRVMRTAKDLFEAGTP